MIELGAAPPVPDTEQLIAMLGKPLKDQALQEVLDDTDTDKVAQYANARRNYLMYRGQQFLAPAWANGTADFQSVGGYGSGSVQGAGQGGDGAAYCYTNNIFRGNGRKFIAVIGQRAPNVTALADDPTSDKGDRAARNANKLNSILDSWWNSDERMMEVALEIFTTGPAYLYTPWNADGDLYGWREEPVYNSSPEQFGEEQHSCIQCGNTEPPAQDGNCPKCSVPRGPEDTVPPESIDLPAQPQVEGTKKYANGRVECHVFGVLYVTTPFYTKDLKRCPWLSLEMEEHKGILLRRFSQLRKKMGELDGTAGIGSGAGAYGKQSRDIVMSPTASPKQMSNSRWTFTRIWLNVWMYEQIKDDDIRAKLYENFPDGLKITMVSGEIVDLENEKLESVWAVIKPEAGEGINIDPIGQDLVSSQIMTNQSLNIGMETLERGIQMILADPRVWNFEQMRKRTSKPAEFIPALPAIGDNLQDSFFATPPAQMSSQQVPFIEMQRSQASENIGITPTIFGGGDSSTAREAEIKKNAAMMQLGISWTYIRKGFECAKTNGTKQLAKYGPAVVQEGKLIVEMADLLEAQWRYEADEAIPQSWGQQRDLLLFMMEKPPQVLQDWGYNHPDNIGKAKSLLGMSGWYTPNVEDIEKFKDVIAELLQAAPVQNPPAQPGGQPDIQPSIPADEYEDNHVLASSFVQAWAQSEQGRTARKENPNGYSNVIAWGKAHAVMANPPAPPPPIQQPRLSLSADLTKLPPQQADALMADFKLAVPPTPPPGPDNLPHQQHAELVKNITEHHAIPQPPQQQPQIQ